jgi:sugar lactone lactonase YvrE
VDGDIATGPAIAGDGTIVFGGSGYAFGVDTAGAPQWAVQLQGPILTASPALSPDGSMLYVGTVHGWFYGIDSAGVIQWSKRLNGTIRYSAPSVAADGTVYIGTSRGLTALEPDGDTLWEFPTEGRVTTTASIAANGTIYVGSLGAVGLGTLHAISPSGSELWRYDGGRLRSSALIGSDGTIYIAPGASVVALQPNGIPIWQFPTERNVMASLALDGNGTLYVAAGEHSLYALEP